MRQLRLVLVLALALSACGRRTPSPTEPPSADATSAAAAPATPQAPPSPVTAPPSAIPVPSMPATIPAFEVREPVTRPTDAPPPVLVLLHGWGSNEADLIALSTRLDPRFLFVSPRAPFDRSEGGGHEWFPLRAGTGASVLADRALQSERALLTWIDEVVAQRRGDPRRVLLLGFSQGAMMATWLARRHPARFAGVVSLSGRAMPMWPSPEPGGVMPPVFVAHGVLDRVIPIDDGRALVRALEAAGATVDAREYPGMAHTIGVDVLADVNAWLGARVEHGR